MKLPKMNSFEYANKYYGTSIVPKIPTNAVGYDGYDFISIDDDDDIKIDQVLLDKLNKMIIILKNELKYSTDSIYINDIKTKIKYVTTIRNAVTNGKLLNKEDKENLNKIREQYG